MPCPYCNQTKIWLDGKLSYPCGYLVSKCLFDKLPKHIPAEAMYDNEQSKKSNPSQND